MFSQQCNSGFCLARCALCCWVGGYVFAMEGVAFITKGQVGALEGNTFFRKVGNHSANGTPACPRRTESPCSQVLVKITVTCLTEPENTSF